MWCGSGAPRDRESNRTPCARSFRCVIRYREADDAEVAAWDERTVAPPGGHVLQSRAWAEYRARAGWRARYLVGDDGSGVLVRVKPWPVVGGASAYVSRGPVPTAPAD